MGNTTARLSVRVAPSSYTIEQLPTPEAFKMAALKKLDVIDLVKAALAIDLPPRAPGHYGFGVPVQNYQQYSDVVKVTVVRLWVCQSYGDVKEIRRLQLVRHAAAALTREDRVLFERDFYYRHEEAKAFVKKGSKSLFPSR